MGDRKKQLLKQYETWMRVQRRNSDNTIKLMTSETHKFLQWLEKKGIKAEDIHQEIIDEYLSFCYHKYSRNTMVVITANLRKFCKHFLAKEVDIRLARSTAPNRDKTSLTKQEIKEMFSCTSGNPLETAILKTLYYSGVRCSELINIDLDDIDFERCQITVKHGKGNKARTVNITNDCVLALQKWLKARPIPKKGYEQAVFISYKRQRITTISIIKMVKRVAARAGITKNVYPHKLRITNITHMAEAGLSISEIAAQSGHLDTKTLLGYIQHTPSRIRKGYDKTFLDMDQNSIEIEVKNMSVLNDEQYKQIAIKKYLDGEIDNTALHSILTTLDNPKNDPKNIDQAYQ